MKESKVTAPADGSVAVDRRRILKVCHVFENDFMPRKRSGLQVKSVNSVSFSLRVVSPNIYKWKPFCFFKLQTRVINSNLDKKTKSRNASQRDDEASRHRVSSEWSLSLVVWGQRSAEQATSCRTELYRFIPHFDKDVTEKYYFRQSNVGVMKSSLFGSFI